MNSLSLPGKGWRVNLNAKAKKNLFGHMTQIKSYGEIQIRPGKAVLIQSIISFNC